MKKLKTWQIVLLVIFYPIGICVLIYRSVKKRKIKREREEAEIALRELKAREEAERKARVDAEIASREYLTFKVVGVTFSNPDGSKRQTILRKIKWGDPPFGENKDGESNLDVTIEYGEYEGEPAFPVYANGQQVGNIGREDIPVFVSRWSEFKGVVSVDVLGGGTDENGKAINYGMTVKCLFKKQPQANI